MASRFVVQASGAMFDTIEPEAWCCVFGVFVAPTRTANRSRGS